MSDIDVVIVNYKSAAHTVNCVDALRTVAKADAVTVSIAVVNNSDDAAELDAGIRRAGGATVVNNSTNLGFGAACNIGARLGNAEIILFLNPDTVPQPGALRGLLGFLHDPANAAVGIAGPEIRDVQDAVVRSCSRLPATADLVARSAGLHALFPDTDYPYLSLAKHARSGPVGQVMGAALAIRRSLFVSLGGFDEAFFLYYEDVDLCARAAAHGAQCFYVKDARVTHLGRASSAQDSGLSLALHIRSRLTYAKHHFGALAPLGLALTTLLLEFPLRLLQAMFGRGVVSVMGVLRAYKLLTLNLIWGTALPAGR